MTIQYFYWLGGANKRLAKYKLDIRRIESAKSKLSTAKSTPEI